MNIFSCLVLCFKAKRPGLKCLDVLCINAGCTWPSQEPIQSYFHNFDVFAMFCSEILCTLVHWMLEVAGLGGMASSVVHFFTLHFFYTYFALFLHFEILVDLMFKVFGGTASSEDE